jgi:hypothetical protein
LFFFFMVLRTIFATITRHSSGKALSSYFEVFVLIFDYLVFDFKFTLVITFDQIELR